MLGISSNHNQPKLLQNGPFCLCIWTQKLFIPNGFNWLFKSSKIWQKATFLKKAKKPTDLPTEILNYSVMKITDTYIQK